MNWTAQERALIAEVARGPHNQASYLVYADWLEERGQEERAAFLRLRAGTLGLLQDDDTLLGRLRERAELRVLREEMDPRWLAALGEPWWLGEVLHTGVRCWIVVRATPRTIEVTWLDWKVVRHQRDQGLGGAWYRPILPDEEAWQRLQTREMRRAARIQQREQITYFKGDCSCFSFWDGQDLFDDHLD